MRGGLIESHAIKEISLGGIDPQRDLEVDHENVSLISLFGSFADTLFSLLGFHSGSYSPFSDRRWRPSLGALYL